MSDVILASAAGPSIPVHALPVALHVELLQIGAQPTEVVIIGQNRLGLGAEEIHIPESDESQ